METPPPNGFEIPPVPHLPTPSGSRHRGSFGSSFSFWSTKPSNSSTFSNNHSISLDPTRSILHASPLRSSPRRQRKPKESINRPHPLANDTTGIFQHSDDDADDEEEYEWGMVDRMRLWRHDALMQHLYETAAFWGDKIVSWTNNPNDAFWLAQIYFMQHQYSRAERLLTRPFSTAPPKHPSTPPLNLTNGDLSTLASKGKGKERDNLPLNAPVPRLPLGPTGIIESNQDGNWSDATEMLGEANPFRDLEQNKPAMPDIDGGIKIEASMCHLRGLLMLKLNRGDQAKNCFMEALALDVKCYDAFEQLISGEMMTPEEEWEFVQGLAYASQAPQDAAFIQLIYTTRLRKYKHAEEHALTRQRLVEEYGLGDNPDVLFSFADALYANFRWSDCFTPLHIACMYHLKHLHSKLFILAHEMVDREPENPISWYAVGVWYLSNGKWAQARQYFSKTSLMDPRFGPAWIAFAHTFAMEGEHDHAVTAYSTCARMFTGSHLPLMFVGMEQITLSNYEQADEALNASYSMCVMAYNHGDYEEAVTLFQRALDLAEVTQSSQHSWTTTYVNLGTCHRKLKQYEQAKEAYQKVLLLDPRHALALGFLGLVYHLLDDLDQAIIKYHEASISFNYGLRDLNPNFGPDQFKIQAARLKEKFIRLKPESKDLFDFYINAATRGVSKGSLSAAPEAMAIG
ncbi:hypothetical protein BDP27DRAFT_1340749 [Rhodocollybia butyracea]|uniref:TPR-like protein n=1 Tax=Rhodocollybia butyracea TaxID=206335 RepID=A0A9P5PBN5_9AGAR|nr:hypothetical protein BDP27DRAFT_1340749 [Rhodocollybia butyracea]